jgi:hypothetical protein
MRFSFFISLFSFLIGIGVVASVESMIAGMSTGEIPMVEKESRIDHDAWVASYVLSRKIDFRIDGVGIDSSDTEVLGMLGRPTKVDQETVTYELTAERFKDFWYDGLMIGTISNERGEFSVDMMELEGGPWKFDGIGIGSSREDIIAAFGKPWRLASNTIYYNTFQTGASLEFSIENDVVVGIRVGYGRC